MRRTCSSRLPAEHQKPASWLRRKIWAPISGLMIWHAVAMVQILACSRPLSSGVRPKTSDQRASITGQLPAEKIPQPRMSMITQSRTLVQ